MPANRTVKVSIGEKNREQGVALEYVKDRHRMSTPFGINGGIVKYDRLAMLAFFIADRGRNLKFAARGQSKLDFVEDLTDNPTVLCYTRNGGEPHVGKTAHVR